MRTEHGILFSGPMVRALLRPVDPKWQTRRAGGLDAVNEEPDAWRFVEFGENVTGASVARFRHRDGSWINIRVRHPVGTRLWVRETSAVGDDGRTHYRADGRPPMGGLNVQKWTPSLLMPRARARIFLDVVSVRVERAQDISDADVAAEGVDAKAVWALWDAATKKERKAADIAELVRPDLHLPSENWRIAWTLINGRESWDANPWVWVYEFTQSSAAGAGASK